MKRRLVCTVLCIVLTLGLFGCAGSPSRGDVPLRIAGLKGPTSMGLVSLMDKAGEGLTRGNYDFSVVTTADEIIPKFIRGELDLICVPANLAAVLYSKTEGKVNLVGINTLGVLYLVTKEVPVSSLADLKHTVIYATGKDTVPEYSLRYLLKQAGLDPDKDVRIEFKSEPTEIVAALKYADTGIAMLPEPFVTVAKDTADGLKVSLDLSREWTELSGGGCMVTGVIVARSEVIEKYPEAVKTFAEEYKDSVAYINNNTADGGALVEKYGIVKAEVAEKAIPACNLVCITGVEKKELLQGYLQTLFDENPSSVGGKMPNEDFYTPNF